MPFDPYTRNLERRVRLLLKEQERLEAENKQLREEKLGLARRLLQHEPKERAGGNTHTADTLWLIARELSGAGHRPSVRAREPVGTGRRRT